MKTLKGFTFIEVVLVLAIAGLIFAMTFIALPSLWASERDTERREDMTTFISTLKNYQMNNSRGALPGSAASTNVSRTDEQRLNDGETIEISGTAVATDRELDKSARTFKDMSWAGFYRDYFGVFEDPFGVLYDLRVSKCATDSTDEYKNRCIEDGLRNIDNVTFSNNPHQYSIHVVVGSTCDGDTAVKSNNERNVSVVYKLERSGQYCYSTAGVSS